jgi:hypothetical protein
MNMTGLEQFHQRKRDDETDSGPFEASQSGVKHPGPTLAQANAALKSARIDCFQIFGLTLSTAVPGVVGCKVVVSRLFFCARMGCSLEMH